MGVFFAGKGCIVSETFEQFCERMNQVEKTDEFIFGRASSGNTRTIFEYDGHSCYLESYGYRRIPAGRMLQVDTNPITPGEMLWVASGEPHDVWIHADWVKGKSAANKLAKQYGGRACPDEYHEDDQDAWYIRFDEDDEGNGFKKLMKLIWDYKTGVLPAETFPWKAGVLT